MSEFAGLDNRTVQQLAKLREDHPEMFNPKGELIQTGLGSNTDPELRKRIEMAQMDRIKNDPAQQMIMKMREERAKEEEERSALGTLKRVLWKDPVKYWTGKEA